MDTTSDLLVAAHHIYARSGGAIGGDAAKRPPVYKVVGIVLAIASGLFIGVSFVLKKMGLLKANVKYQEEAGEGYGYLKNAWWWTGMILMIIGEICNFVAYAFVDAILVTPLGALSVVVTTILSAIFLKERLSFVGKVGCFNCIIGSIVIVINAPEQSAVADIQDMKELVISPGFLSYAGVVIVGCTVVAFWLGPKYGKKTMMVYLSICSLIGGLSVVATQGLGAAVVAQASGKSQFKEWFTYVLLVFVVTTLLTEIIYLNKALNLFNAALVTPTYYVFFTSATIVTSAVLFRGFKGTASTISTVIMGFLQICAGVILLQLSKSAKDVPDAAVFSGDIDQVRTIAEQEEPEYEPRADTIRGGASIIRSLSRNRTEKQVQEVKRIHEEHMQPIGENEHVEWDGLRRRKTVLDPDRAPTIVRRQTLHPPLGMSHFPSHDDSASEDDDIHPGFFTRLRARSRGKSNASGQSVGLTEIPTPPPKDTPPSSSSGPHTYGLPAALRNQDTSYKAPHPAIHWGNTPSPAAQDRPKSKDELKVPRPPPHIAKRQFSFQNVFGRNRAESTGDRPTSKHSRKGSREKVPTDGATEEERLGLVKGDSSVHLAVPREVSPSGYSDAEDGWNSSPEQNRRAPPGQAGRTAGFDGGSGQRVRRVDTEESDIASGSSYEKEKEIGGGGAFL